MIKSMFKAEYIFKDIKIENNSKEKAIHKISELCCGCTGIPVDHLNKAFVEREYLGSTGFGNHLAIPHAKIKGLSKPMISIFRFNEGVEWQSLDNKKVKVAVAMIMPEDDEENIHLKILSMLARKLVHSEFINMLLNEVDNYKLYNFIIKEMEE